MERYFDSCFSSFLQNRLPPFQKQFLSYIVQSAKLFDQRLSMDLNLLRNFYDSDQLNLPTCPPNFSLSQTFSKTSIDMLPVQPFLHRKSNHVDIIDASVFLYCNSSDCSDPHSAV